MRDSSAPPPFAELPRSGEGSLASPVLASRPVVSHIGEADAAASSPVPGNAPILVQTKAVTFGGKLALGPLDLTLTEQRIGIIGRNGSGKTTLLRLLAGLIKADAGSVTIGGADAYRDRRAALRHVGILFQNPDHQILFPMVEEELAFGLTQQGMKKPQARQAACALLAQHGRSHWVGRAVSTLSGGQKQWLCLMSVLLMEPQTILLDEPYSGLDLPTALRLRRRFAAVPQRLITISHDPAAFADCSRILWLEAGRVVADGAAEPVLAAYSAKMAELGACDADTDLPG